MKRLASILVLFAVCLPALAQVYLYNPTNSPGLAGQQAFTTGIPGYYYWGWGTNAQSSNATVVAASPSIGVTTNGFVYTPFWSAAMTNWLNSLLVAATNNALIVATNNDLAVSNKLWLQITNGYVIAGANVTVTTNASGQTISYTIASTGGGATTNVFIAAGANVTVTTNVVGSSTIYTIAASSGAGIAAAAGVDMLLTTNAGVVTFNFNTSPTNITQITFTGGGILSGAVPTGANWASTNPAAGGGYAGILWSNGQLYVQGQTNAALAGATGAVDTNDVNGAVGRSTALPMAWIKGLTTNTWYVGPTNNTGFFQGSASNDGLTPFTAWDRQTFLNNLVALSGPSPSSKNTFIILNGIWNDTMSFPAGFSNVVIRSSVRWGCQENNCAGSGYAFQFTPYSHDIVLDGLWTQNAGNHGFDLDAYNLIITNCGSVGAIWQGYNSSNIGSSNNLFVADYAYGNGATNDAVGGPHMHNYYISCANNEVRNCVGAYPTNGANFQFYTQNGSGAPSTGNRLINSYSIGATNIQGVIFYGTNAGVASAPLGTNWMYNNFISDGVQLRAGVANLTNNIILPPLAAVSASTISTGQGVTVNEDYNLGTNTLGGGAHDVLTTFGAIGFVNYGAGLYWLNGTNAAAASGALTTALPSRDFFDYPQTKSEGGFFGPVGYRTQLAADTRTFNPMPTGGADYWRWTDLNWLYIGANVTGLLPSSVTPTNTLTQAGVVTPGTGHPNSSWSTDASGNTSWLPDTNGNVPFTTVQTNFVMNQYYTNKSGQMIMVSANAALTVSAATGNAQLDLMADQNGGNTFTLLSRAGIGTTASTIAESYTNAILGVLSNNAVWYFTNTSSGGSDAATIATGTGTLTTFGNVTAAAGPPTGTAGGSFTGSYPNPVNTNNPAYSTFGNSTGSAAAPVAVPVGVATTFPSATNAIALAVGPYGTNYLLQSATPTSITNITGSAAGVITWADFVVSNSTAAVFTNWLPAGWIAHGSIATNMNATLGITNANTVPAKAEAFIHVENRGTIETVYWLSF